MGPALLLRFFVTALGLGLVGGFLCSCSEPKSVTLVINNPLDLQRINEGVSLPLSQLPSWVGKVDGLKLSTATDGRLDHQLDDLDQNGEPDELYFSSQPGPARIVDPAPEPRLGPAENSIPPALDSGGGNLPLNSLQPPPGMFRPLPSQRPVSPGPTPALERFLSGSLHSQGGNPIPHPGRRPAALDDGTKTLWQAKTETYLVHHRLSLARNDPLMLSRLEKIRWPASTPLRWQLQAPDHRIKAFASRWAVLPQSSRYGLRPMAVLFQPTSLASLKPLPVRTPEVLTQNFTDQKSVTVALMIASDGEYRSATDWDRNTERAYQRWLNPIDVIVVK
ncbi:MAG: DUF4861 domain-containing protein [Blastochloris sp.]|nr:DUF4861 domain-containing protein [Blastochloris sp.]